jgi:PAS domain S-box-containing protein
MFDLDKLSLRHKGAILVGLPLLVNLVFFAVQGFLKQQADNQAVLARHSTTIVTAANTLNKDFWNAGIGLAIYGLSSFPLAGLSQIDSATAERQYNQCMAEIKQNLQTLETLCKGNKVEEDSLAEIKPVLLEALDALEEDKEELSTGGYKALQHLRGYEKELITLSDQLTKKFDAIIQEENRLSRNEQAQRSSMLVDLCVRVGVGLNCCLAGILFTFFIKNISGRLSVLTDNTRRLEKEQPLHPPISGADEIALLDSVFHHMAITIVEAARKERAIIRNALDVICSLDPDGNFLAVNQASLKAWGYEPEELIGHQHTNIILPEDIAGTLQKERDIIDGKSSAPIENRVQRKNGSVVHTLWSAHWSEAEQALFCVAHDITERKEIEAIKQEFVAMVSHDLKAPLTALRFFLDFLEMGQYGELHDEGKEEVEAAQRSVLRLINLINDLLDLEKLEAGELKLKLEPVPVATLMEDSVNAISAFAKQREVPLNFKSMDVDVYVDGERIVQVLVNLLSNAVKFSPQGATVSLYAEQQNGWVELKVADNGRGIPEEHREKIFQRFKQIEESDGRGKKGTGLGLPICKTIIEAHGGAIGVVSEVGKGSTFWVRVPAYQQG